MSKAQEHTLYSKALFNICLLDNKLERVYQDMQLLNDLLLKDNSFNKFISNPLISIMDKERMFDKVFKTVLDEKSFRFVIGLFKRRVHKLIADIIADFIAKYKAYKNVIVVHITTVCRLNDELRFIVKNLVKKVTKCSDIEVLEHLDASLIGGYKLRFNDFQLDRSIKFLLEKLLTLDYNFKVNS